MEEVKEEGWASGRGGGRNGRGGMIFFWLDFLMVIKQGMNSFLKPTLPATLPAPGTLG